MGGGRGVAASKQAGEARKEVQKSEGMEAKANAKRMKPLTGGGRSGVGGYRVRRGPKMEKM